MADKPPRKFELKDIIIIQRDGLPRLAIIWGYEYSDGIYECGTPKAIYKGWFYHIRIEGNETELIVPENILVRG